MSSLQLGSKWGEASSILSENQCAFDEPVVAATQSFRNGLSGDSKLISEFVHSEPPRYVEIPEFNGSDESFFLESCESILPTLGCFVQFVEPSKIEIKSSISAESVQGQEFIPFGKQDVEPPFTLIPYKIEYR